MRLAYKKGNVFNTQMKVIAHGVNCKYAFGAGIAKQIAIIYPEVKEAYLRFPKWTLGEVQVVPTKDGRIIANCATQEGYGYSKNQKVYVDYDAVRTCFDHLYKVIHNVRKDGKDFNGIAMPQIGCGLAGGKWDIIEQILKDTLKEYDVPTEVYIL